jgi:hypothetical protein
LVPDQPPLAVHVVALVEDHVSVEDPPEESEVGFALIVTVGAAVPEVTVTFTLLFVLPFDPVQVMV